MQNKNECTRLVITPEGVQVLIVRTSQYTQIGTMMHVNRHVLLIHVNLTSNYLRERDVSTRWRRYKR